MNTHKIRIEEPADAAYTMVPNETLDRVRQALNEAGALHSEYHTRYIMEIRKELFGEEVNDE